MDVLQLDVSGRPQAWIHAREAAVLYASEDEAAEHRRVLDRIAAESKGRLVWPVDAAA